jgi:SAM-dependent methyltransferase
VRATPGTDVTQLSSWARVRAVVGYRPTYVFARRGGWLVGGCQVLSRPLSAFELAYVPYGPVTAVGMDDGGAVTRALTDRLARLGREVSALFVQPAEGDTGVTERLLGHGFRPSQAQVAPAGSLRVDLSVGLEQVAGRAKGRLRPAARLWARNGVAVRIGDERDLPLLADLVACSAAVHGYTPLPLDYLRVLHRELNADGQVLLLIGEAAGVPVVADLLTVNGDMIRGRLVGFDRSGDAAGFGVPAAVTWEGIRWAQARGLRWYDVGGVPAAVLDDMLDRGVRFSADWSSSVRAKLGWGAEPFRYPGAVELISSRVLRAGYDAARGSAAGHRLLDALKRRLRA